MSSNSQTTFHNPNLNRAIIGSGLTTKQLAKRCGVSEQTISHWTTGKTSTPHCGIEKVADVLGTSIEFLIGQSAMDENLNVAHSLIRGEATVYLATSDIVIVELNK